MRLIELTPSVRRDDTVAQLCAEVYGPAAGLTPLIAYTGAVMQWLPNDTARVLALVDDQDKLLSVALLVLELEGQGAELKWLSTPEAKRNRGYATQLIKKLTASMALKVNTTDAALETWLSTCGFKHWVHRDIGERVGLNRQMREQDATVPLDENRILRLFKTDPASFERYKDRFVAGVQRFSSYC